MLQLVSGESSVLPQQNNYSNPTQDPAVFRKPELRIDARFPRLEKLG
jgi:hypothetical protein